MLATPQLWWENNLGIYNVFLELLALISFPTPLKMLPHWLNYKISNANGRPKSWLNKKLSGEAL
jgi:hypothetical protein